ncbi:hypothetical protein G7048_27435 (plasmid) [Diaphorobacter sp. HDW4B]|uniref:hypothetical protein n=1 Tax=Diaphorobacter sp. HDW4B TaxID=2714925 RepID=UPI0014089204|nr:hypothetical protein [Diaphorobacter sp. HDW4B]QIL73753.1 hypothetical protein G7048_27435 [Diaphorobacter sp. HDW4B]
MTKTLPFAELERIYDELAQAIDQCGVENESLFLSKLVLCLAHEHDNGARVSELIAQCLNSGADLPADSNAPSRLI